MLKGIAHTLAINRILSSKVHFVEFRFCRAYCAVGMETTRGTDVQLLLQRALKQHDAETGVFHRDDDDNSGLLGW